MKRTKPTTAAPRVQPPAPSLPVGRTLEAMSKAGEPTAARSLPVGAAVDALIQSPPSGDMRFVQRAAAELAEEARDLWDKLELILSCLDPRDSLDDDRDEWRLPPSVAHEVRTDLMCAVGWSHDEGLQEVVGRLEGIAEVNIIRLVHVFEQEHGKGWREQYPEVAASYDAEAEALCPPSRHEHDEADS